MSADYVYVQLTEADAIVRCEIVTEDYLPPAAYEAIGQLVAAIAEAENRLSDLGVRRRIEGEP